MRILINCSNLKLGGAIQVADSFVSMLDQFPQHSFWVVLSKQTAYLASKITTYSNCEILYYDLVQSWQGVFLGRNSALDRWVKELNIERVFTIFGPSLWRPRVPHVCGFARPQIIYTESPFWRKISLAERVKSKLREAVKLYNFRITSDLFITENQDVSDRLSRLVGNCKPVYTVTNNYNQLFDQPKNQINNIVLPSFDGMTLLTISANYPHKNLTIIYSVIDAIVEQQLDLKVRFVLTLTEDQFPLKDRYRDFVYLIGPVSIEQCPNLYRQADVMFLPTLLECFSASYAEAMRMEVPILTSDLPFARGLCGAAAIYCNPLSVESIIERLVEMQRDSVVSRLKKEGLKQLKEFNTSHERAQKYIEIVEQLI